MFYPGGMFMELNAYVAEVGMREGGEPLPLVFQHLIFMIRRPCDLNLVMISSLASKCQYFKVEMPFFQPLYVMKLKTSKFKVLAF